MYVLYIANKTYSSWSLRPWLLMRVLGIGFEERLVPFAEGNFKSFSPSGKVPCLLDDGRVVWDSLAICEYLAERHGGVWPADAAARAWARSAAAEMHSGFQELRTRCNMNLGLRIQIQDIPEPLASDIARIEEIWQEGLGSFGGPFVAGSAFTAVDAFFAPVAWRWHAAALAEPWREARYEESSLAAGRFIEDLRQPD